MDSTKTAAAPQTPELVEVSGHSYGKPRPVRAVVELAASQDGVVELGQLVELGVSRDWIEHRIRAGWLTIVFRGVYAVGHKRITWRGRLRAAVLSCGPGAFLSHHTAGVLHGLWRYWGGAIHVTVPPGGREDRQEGIVVHRIRNMRAVEKGEVDGLPVTSVARTCLDLAARVHPATLDGMLEAAERDGTFHLHSFIAVCKRGRNGSAKLRRAIRRYEPTGWTRSRLERKGLRLLRKAGLRPSGVNVWVPGANVEVDILFEEGLAIEIDGGVVHGTTAAKIRDPLRDTKLQIAGYATMRIPEYRLVHEPERVVADVKALLLSRAARTPARPDR
jgi:very-short-patch-repair endonuclease